ncbi:MAG: hypothetical protein ACR2JS_00140 [Candidatus Nanopelagicales bacterium]
MARLVAGGVTLRNQINKRWPKRDKASDGWIGDKAHAARQSDHNADSRGIVHALDIDADLDPRDPKAAQRLADQIVAYAASGIPGSQRIKYVVYNDRIASGTYEASKWRWRGSGYGHKHHIHVSFTTRGENDGGKFPLPILATPKK